jgi:hypothetical protein
MFLLQIKKSGSIMEDVDHKVSLIPDFISNCGMARVFCISWKRSTHDCGLFSRYYNYKKCY